MTNKIIIGSTRLPISEILHHFEVAFYNIKKTNIEMLVMLNIFFGCGKLPEQPFFVKPVIGLVFFGFVWGLLPLFSFSVFKA